MYIFLMLNIRTIFLSNKIKSLIKYFNKYVNNKNNIIL